MSSGLGKGIGIPVKLLHEAEGHTVTVRRAPRDPTFFPLIFASEKRRVCCTRVRRRAIPARSAARREDTSGRQRVAPGGRWKGEGGRDMCRHS